MIEVRLGGKRHIGKAVWMGESFGEGCGHWLPDFRVSFALYLLGIVGGRQDKAICLTKRLRVKMHIVLRKVKLFDAASYTHTSG